MLRLLRNKQTGMYWAGRAWVKEWDRAQRFEDALTAYHTVADHDLRNSELVLQFGEKPDPFYDVSLEVRGPTELRIQIKPKETAD